MKNMYALLFLMCSAILFQSCKNRTDEEIQTDIREKLSAQQGEGSGFGNVQANVEKGVVTLTGSCEGENCADSVATRVKDIDGVKEVVNNLQQTTAPTDFTLRTSVQNIISKYQGVQADVASGVVVLRGSIIREQLQPLMNELSTVGAKKIDNQLAVQ